MALSLATSLAPPASDAPADPGALPALLAAAGGRPVDLARERVLPVLPALRELLAGEGLRRGSTVAVDAGAGSGATSLALALAAGPSLAGSWVVVVGMPSLGLAAAASAGLVFERLAVVPEPPADAWATVVAALVDTVDVVVVRRSGGERGTRPGRVRASDARRLSARVRERGAVLIEVGDRAQRSADLRFAVSDTRWEGLGAGHGHLRARRATVEVEGRREAARLRRAELWLPGPDGRVSPVVGDSGVGNSGRDDRARTVVAQRAG